MENSVCKIKTLYTPNRRYANTVNLVFFRAIPLTKNFNEYVDGLRDWKEYIKVFPDSQLQVFIDKAISMDEEVMGILHNLDARIYLFECSDYLIKDGFHIGLFGTMLRFFPMFDINTHAMSVAHMCDLEPGPDTLQSMSLISRLSGMKGPSMIYESKFIYTKIFDSQQTLKSGVPFPWVAAGKFAAFNKVPFSLLTTFLENIKKNKKFYNRFEGRTNPDNIQREHGNFSYGIDEMFLNHIYLPWLIKNKAIIVIVIKKVNPESFVRVASKHIYKQKESKRHFEYILKKNQSITKSIGDFISIFDDGVTKENEPISLRFIETLKKHPGWFGRGISELWPKMYELAVNKSVGLVVKDGMITEMIKL
jgi:hypothetical protein